MCIRKINLTGMCRMDGKSREWRQGNHLSRSTLNYFFTVYYVPGPDHCVGQVKRA